jgi:lipopolysaccharide transport system permease protein
MTRVVYTAGVKTPLRELLSPIGIARELLSHRELIAAYTKREFHSAHRGTYLGLIWSVLSPLIMLALFVGVFGHIFGGKFTSRPDETASEFALALFIGLGFFNCFSQCMGGASGLVLSNSAYVKSLSFPLHILSVSSVLNSLMNLTITITICVGSHIAIYGNVHPATVWLIAHVIAIALFGLGISWFISGLSVFVRDIPAMIPPITTVLMFGSGVFFPLSAVSPRMRSVLMLNPLAVIIDQARSALMTGVEPRLVPLAAVLGLSLAFAIAGYTFFRRAAPAFADVV